MNFLASRKNKKSAAEPNLPSSNSESMEMTQSENTKERLAGTQFGKLPKISRKQELIPFTLINGYAWTLTLFTISWNILIHQEKNLVTILIIGNIEILIDEY